MLYFIAAIGVALALALGAGIECVWTDDEARSDLISHIQAVPASLHYAVQAAVHGTHPPANSIGMDTAKFHPDGMHRGSTSTVG